MGLLNKSLSIKGISLSVLLVIGLYYVSTRESDIERIQMRLTLLAVQASFGAVELHPLENLGEARKVSAYFTDPLKVQLVLKEEREILIKSRKELEQRFIAARSYLSELQVAFSDMRIRMKDGAAAVELRANALGRAKGEEGQFLEIHRLLLSLHELNGEWMISSVEHLENLREPTDKADE